MKLKRIEHRFLLSFLFLTLCALIFIPPFSTPDFAQQFLRAFEISQGTFVTSIIDENGFASLPKGLIPADLSSYGDIAIGPNQRILAALFSTDIDMQSLSSYKYVTQAVYSPLTFLPAAIGIRIALLFTTNLGVLIYAARIASLATVTVILYLAIKNMPTKRDKSLFSLFALLPLFLETCPSASADGITFALIAALYSYVMQLRLGGGQ